MTLIIYVPNLSIYKSVCNIALVMVFCHFSLSFLYIIQVGDNVTIETEATEPLNGLISYEVSLVKIFSIDICTFNRKGWSLRVVLHRCPLVPKTIYLRSEVWTVACTYTTIHEQAQSNQACNIFVSVVLVSLLRVQFYSYFFYHWQRKSC